MSNRRQAKSMFQVTNISANALKLSTGKTLAAGKSAEVKTIGLSERKYQDRGWLNVVEIKPVAAHDLNQEVDEQKTPESQETDDETHSSTPKSKPSKAKNTDQTTGGKA